jgi:CheY-like chemotaxis protein
MKTPVRIDGSADRSSHAQLDERPPPERRCAVVVHEPPRRDAFQRLASSAGADGVARECTVVIASAPDLTLRRALIRAGAMEVLDGRALDPDALAIAIDTAIERHALSSLRVERARTEEALRKTEEALRKTEGQLREANRARAEFVTMLAHELRNPLSPVRNAVEILRRVGPNDPQVLERVRELIDRQVTQMARLIDDLFVDASERDETESASQSGRESGAAFTVPSPSERETSSPPSGLSVLVVDDNRDTAETLSALLALDGHRVALAYDGTSAVSLAREQHPEVIISDLGLPGELDGYAIARELRADATLPPAMMIALSGYASEDARRQSADAGFDLHLAKPPDLKLLGAVLAGAARPEAAAELGRADGSGRGP